MPRNSIFLLISSFLHVCIEVWLTYRKKSWFVLRNQKEIKSTPNISLLFPDLFFKLEVNNIFIVIQWENIGQSENVSVKIRKKPNWMADVVFKETCVYFIRMGSDEKIRKKLHERVACLLLSRSPLSWISPLFFTPCPKTPQEFLSRMWLACECLEPKHPALFFYTPSQRYLALVHVEVTGKFLNHRLTPPQRLVPLDWSAAQVLMQTSLRCGS